MTLADHLAGGVEQWRLDLISAYSHTIYRYAPKMQARFPGHDVEPAMFQALYLAAMTYRPGKQGFFRWLNTKIAGSTANFRRTDERRSARKIYITDFYSEAFDSRFYYSHDFGTDD